jgi:hypothetical protein
MTRKSKIKIDAEDFQVPPGKKVNLRDWPTVVKPIYETKESYKEILEDHVKKMSSQQELLYAFNFSRDGFCWQGWRDSSRFVRDQSRRLPSLQFQATKCGRAEA